MNVVVIGSGGREHALCSAFKKGANIEKIYCIPGNAGTGLIATNVNLKIEDFEQIKKFVKNMKFQLQILKLNIIKKNRLIIFVKPVFH